MSDRTFEDGPVASWGMHLESVAATMDSFKGGETPSCGLASGCGQGWGCDSDRLAPWVDPFEQRSRERAQLRTGLLAARVNLPIRGGL